MLPSEAKRPSRSPPENRSAARHGAALHPLSTNMEMYFSTNKTGKHMIWINMDYGFDVIYIDLYWHTYWYIERHYLIPSPHKTHHQKPCHSVSLVLCPRTPRCHHFHHPIPLCVWKWWIYHDWSPIYGHFNRKSYFLKHQSCVFPWFFPLKIQLQNHRKPGTGCCLQKTPQCLFDVCCTPIKALRLSAGPMWSEHSSEKSSESVWITCMMCVCVHVYDHISI